MPTGQPDQTEPNLVPADLVKSNSSQSNKTNITWDERLNLAK